MRRAERSIGVLRCNPGDHESRLSFAALRDLLEDAYDETAAKLPAPQRRALAIALLREEPAAPLDRGAVSTAFLDLPARALAQRASHGRRGRCPVARPPDRFRAHVRHTPSQRRAGWAHPHAPVGWQRPRPPRPGSGAVTATAPPHRPGTAEPRRAPGDAPSSAWAIRGRGPSCGASTRTRVAIRSSRSRSQGRSSAIRCVRDRPSLSPGTSRSCSGRELTSFRSVLARPSWLRRCPRNPRRTSSQPQPGWISRRTMPLPWPNAPA